MYSIVMSTTSGRMNLPTSGSKMTETLCAGATILRNSKSSDRKKMLSVEA